MKGNQFGILEFRLPTAVRELQDSDCIKVDRKVQSRLPEGMCINAKEEIRCLESAASPPAQFTEVFLKVFHFLLMEVKSINKLLSWVSLFL